ncbi:MAG TPA: ROK family transcriptional regulator [Sphaerochaeta sp.]|nr:ROK family transcriptional regulator [Sphaerochaeta sp.]
MPNTQFELKNLNRRAVLKFIRKQQEVTKADIAKVTGLTTMAIHKIVTELETLGMIRKGSLRTGGVGRSAVTYTIDESYKYSIGIHINVYRTTVAVVNLKGTILAKESIKIHNDSVQTFIDALVASIEKMLATAEIDRSEVVGIGIGAPGPVDVSQGMILTPPNFPLLEYLPIEQILASRTKLPVYLAKDANAIALGVFWHGDHLECDDLLYIDIDMGIGAGLVIDGRIRKGFTESAGEIGHMIISPDGPRCNCGNRGCLEAVASGLALVRDFSAYLARHSDHPLYPNRSSLGIEDLLGALAKHDVAALDFINQSAYYTGLVVRNLLNALDPSLIVLGGMIVTGYPHYVKIVEDVAHGHQMRGSRVQDTITTELHSDMGVIGAATVVADHFFEEIVLRES